MEGLSQEVSRPNGTTHKQGAYRDWIGLSFLCDLNDKGSHNAADYTQSFDESCRSRLNWDHKSLCFCTSNEAIAIDWMKGKVTCANSGNSDEKSAHN